jgi:hypothetical protein
VDKKASGVSSPPHHLAAYSGSYGLHNVRFLLSSTFLLSFFPLLCLLFPSSRRRLTSLSHRSVTIELQMVFNDVFEGEMHLDFPGALTLFLALPTVWAVIKALKRIQEGRRPMPQEREDKTFEVCPFLFLFSASQDELTVRFNSSPLKLKLVDVATLALGWCLSSRKASQRAIRPRVITAGPAEGAKEGRVGRSRVVCAGGGGQWKGIEPRYVAVASPTSPCEREWTTTSPIFPVRRFISAFCLAPRPFTLTLPLDSFEPSSALSSPLLLCGERKEGVLTNPSPPLVLALSPRQPVPRPPSLPPLPLSPSFSSLSRFLTLSSRRRPAPTWLTSLSYSPLSSPSSSPLALTHLNKKHQCRPPPLSKSSLVVPLLVETRITAGSSLITPSSVVFFPLFSSFRRATDLFLAPEQSFASYQDYNFDSWGPLRVVNEVRRRSLPFSLFVPAHFLLLPSRTASRKELDSGSTTMPTLRSGRTVRSHSFTCSVKERTDELARENSRRRRTRTQGLDG